ncbi:MAG: 16S rRNA (cytidine(1402)-2'-O)-methyltransferase [Pseudomonadota bacterium]
MNHRIVPLSAGLTFVASPIGTARDITLRALDVLASADILAAEDTRTLRKLMEIHGVPLGERQVVAYHEHSTPAVRERLVSDMRAGKSLAYASEAGTPLVADPGYQLARAAIEAGLDVDSTPGPSAVLAALAIAGLPSDRFFFAGFAPSAKTQRQTWLAELREISGTLVLYESPKRLSGLLTDACDTLGHARQAVICRELTKKFQEVARGTLSELSDDFANRNVKGEVVVLIDRPGQNETEEKDIEAALKDALKTHSVKDAATVVAGALSVPRREVYQMALSIGKSS